MIKFTRTEITEYALYNYMKRNITDFSVIFSGHQIISAIINRYDLDGRFNQRVLDLMPLLDLSGITTEEFLNEFVDRLVDDTVADEFLLVEQTFDGQVGQYYIKNTI